MLPGGLPRFYPLNYRTFVRLNPDALPYEAPRCEMLQLTMGLSVLVSASFPPIDEFDPPEDGGEV